MKNMKENKEWRPLPEQITIKESKIEGLGVFATGFFNLLHIFLTGFPSLEFLSYLHSIFFIFTFTCSFIFIYFLFKILLLEILLKRS